MCKSPRRSCTAASQPRSAVLDVVAFHDRPIGVKEKTPVIIVAAQDGVGPGRTVLERRECKPPVPDSWPMIVMVLLVRETSDSDPRIASRAGKRSHVEEAAEPAVAPVVRGDIIEGRLMPVISFLTLSSYA